MKTKLAAGLVLSFFLTGNASGADGSSQEGSKDQLAPITIAVYDYVHAKPGVLQQAEGAAAAILAKAAVETTWLACSADNTSPSSPGCAAGAAPTHLTLRILPDSMSHGLRSVDGDALGFAALGAPLSCDAWIFYDRVKDFALREQMTFERLLGAVIAHELGHLLLGENAHARAGLMHGYWSSKELVAIESLQLLFSDTDSKRIQSGVVARRRAAFAG